MHPPRDIFDALHDGNLVILNIGYYVEDDPSDTSEGLPLMRRTGGHYVVPTGIYGHAGKYRLWYNDPARGVGSTSDQSAFRAERTDLAVTWLHSLSKDGTETCTRSRFALTDRVPAYIDGMIVIETP